MNHTHIRGFTKVESAYAFLNKQIQRHRTKERARYEQAWVRAKRSMAMSLVTSLVIVTNWTHLTTKAYDEPTFDSTVRLDKESFTLLAVEESAPAITPGKSLAQVQAETARARQIARQSGFVASANVVTASTEEAHRLAKEAAQKAGIPDQWKLLAAIWQKESGKKIYSCIVSKADGRAVGPMQFMPGTFRGYEADGNGDGKKDICDAKDALVAGANLLKANGVAEGKVDQAVLRYNHSMVYVKSVKQIAESID